MMKMRFKLIPVKEKPEYIKVNLGFMEDNHDHLPIIWRNTYRTGYGGFAYYAYKVGMVNLHAVYENYLYWLDEVLKKGGLKKIVFDIMFIKEFLRIYYHEFLHLFFKFRAEELRDKKGYFYNNEEYIDALAMELVEIDFINDWSYEIFDGEI